MIQNIILTTLISLMYGSLSFANCSLGIEQKSKADKFNYLLIPGIFNEFLSFYMTEHRRHLISLGVPASQIHRLNNKSYIKPEENVSYIQKALESMDKTRKTVVIAHSKGALESLYYFNKYDDFDGVERVFLIQGALDGSSSYKMIMNDKPLRGFLKYVRALKRFKFIKDFSESFNFRNVRERLKGISKKNELLDKITFIETEKKLRDLHPKFSVLGGLYQESFNTAGDGVLLRADHVPYELEGVKTVCREFYEMDHGDLVKAAPWESLRVKKIKMFMDDLLLGFKRDQ